MKLGSVVGMGLVVFSTMSGCHASQSLFPASVPHSDGGADDPGAIRGDWTSEQGTELLGFANLPASITGFSLQVMDGNIPGTAQVVAPGELVIERADHQERRGMAVQGVEVNAVDAAGQHPVHMIIDNVEPSAGIPGAYLYTLKLKDPTYPDGAPACIPTESPPLGLPNEIAAPDYRALVVPGAWGSNGYYAYSDATHFTFGCVSAVVAKCDFWGEGPFNDQQVTTPDGVTHTVYGHDWLQACTRMARADYCANGQPHTYNRTLIERWSVLPDTMQAARAGFEFEAPWSAIQGVAALCLSKLRWMSRPLNEVLCPNLLDPRVPHPGHNTVYFCEDFNGAIETGYDPTTPSPAALAAMAQAGALLFNRSRFNDVGLNTWTSCSTMDCPQYTTTLLVDNGPTLGTTSWASSPPPTNWSGTMPASGTETLEGIIFSAANRQPDNTVALGSYYSHDLDDYQTTTTAPGGDYKGLALEGYIYTTEAFNRHLVPATARPLWLYQSAKHSLTTTREMDASWRKVKLLGFVLR
jgi:hypothetical protein